MAPQDEQRISTRLSEKDPIDCDDNGEMDEGEHSTPPRDTSDIKDESWEDQEICEMVDPVENWRVVGLANVGNTCFTNAILQVFSYAVMFSPWLTLLDKPRFLVNILYSDMRTFHRR